MKYKHPNNLLTTHAFTPAANVQEPFKLPTYYLPNTRFQYVLVSALHTRIHTKVNPCTHTYTLAHTMGDTLAISVTFQGGLHTALFFQ